ncbi:GNAT family N-acetyltransferase [Nocardioides gilvus]|uniref:GNAT family N-acetyltransferase n=1 Tax=Nocardioides gilvus TaxID=1735589 RepID=UPI000D74B675|nr:GNAT family N-acetyltransferase [Nocardioides gilvus]
MTTPPHGLRLERRTITHPDAALLVAMVQAEYVQRYGGEDEAPIDPGEFEPGRGTFLVGYVEGVPVATGAWRWHATPDGLDAQRCVELKRMFVVDGLRRRGIAALLLEALEDDARATGADAVVLETGINQPEAIALYERRGYVPVPGFGHHRDSPLSRCFAKWLTR